MCLEAPVARKAYADAKRRHSSVSFLGIVGDQSHATRKSGHNCGYGRELSCTHPSYAHAVDIGVPNTSVGYDLVREFKRDPRVYYILYRGLGYRPNHRGGGTFGSFDHETHVHVSFGCGSTFDTRPFFAPEKKVMTPTKFRQIMNLAERAVREKNPRRLYVKRPVMRGEDVALVKKTVGHNVYGTGYGLGVARKVGDLQEFWGMRRTEKVGDQTWKLIYFENIAKYLGY